ncbi:hypothetical protein [Asticcacaulis sp. YBE204]|uniref:hypothetical protein n=1 Tax=Asticcacaulis sp. YBE204 TaxID=1282363 RepID=UPI0003C3F5F5|nr:hypothetical protein [Asticcacaulis sp. YBE204]ESQ79721.1 hypothetical protein AEYBE204_07715 [Asticcacaulis sp. YBE204]
MFTARTARLHQLVIFFLIVSAVSAVILCVDYNEVLGAIPDLSYYPMGAWAVVVVLYSSQMKIEIVQSSQKRATFKIFSLYALSLFFTLLTVVGISAAIFISCLYNSFGIGPLYTYAPHVIYIASFLMILVLEGQRVRFLKQSAAQYYLNGAEF